MNLGVMDLSCMGQASWESVWLVLLTQGVPAPEDLPAGTALLSAA